MSFAVSTPLRDNNRDTYRYFGNPIYQYSLCDGIVTHFDRLRARASRLDALQQKVATELDALLPSILDRAFKGGL